MLQDGGRTKARLQTVSVTGGLLRLTQSLEQGDFVEIAFQTQSGPVRGMAEMLAANRTRSEVMQAFRFLALGDEDHRALRTVLESAADQSFAGLRSKQFSKSNAF
jgi:(p)ppGpp synthase/HD superfamily hydrolase